MNPQNSHHITLLLLTKNESENLKNNFGWLKKCPVINEIVVVDDNSTDDTIKIAKSWENKNLKVNVFSRGLDGDFSAQRTFGSDNASNDWIFWLDADETPKNKVINFLNNFKFDPAKVYAFKRQDIFLGRKLSHGENKTNNFVRLFDRHNGKFAGQVHEIWKSNLPIDLDCGVIEHQTAKTLKSFLEKLNFYSNIRAQELYLKKVHAGLFDIIAYPTAKFFQNYFIKQGFLDSTAGIIMALSMSFHSFLVRSKLWHMSQR